MKKFFLLIAFAGLLGVSNAQMVQGTIRNGANPNQVVLSIRPSLAFTAQMSDLIVTLQIPTSVGPRPTLALSNLQSSFFSVWDQQDADQADLFYTWSFNCASPGASNTTATLWAASEMDVLTIDFQGAAVPPFTTRIAHYLDGGIGGFAVFYVETSLAAVNGGVLSDWGNLFYGTGAVNGAAAAGSIGTPNALYSFSTAPNIVLPVKFLGFNAVKKDNTALLTWQVENETALTDHYEIERSVNGVDFGKVATVLSKNNGSSTNTYDLTDLNLTAVRTSGVIYYRVKQFDKDGKFVTTPVKSVRLDGKQLAVAVYPNPIRNYANVTLDLVDDAEVLLTITDASGKQVQNLQWQLFKGPNVRKINMANVASGSYMLKVQAGTETKVVPLVKAN